MPSLLFGSFPRDFGPSLRRHTLSPRCATLLTERLGGLVLAVVGSGVFLDLARQNLGDANRGGYGGGDLAVEHVESGEQRRLPWRL